MLSALMKERPRKRPKLHKVINFFIITFLFLVSFSAFSIPRQLHTHIGPVTGSYSGDTTFAFSVPQGVNIEFEIFDGTRESYLGRMTFAVDPTRGKMVYYGTFFGARYYWRSHGKITDISDGKTRFSSVPKYRFYYGWDVGISQVVIKEVGLALSVVSSLIDFGGHAGAIYQLGKNWGIEGQFAMSYGYAISTVAVAGTSMKMLVGGSYYFD